MLRSRKPCDLRRWQWSIRIQFAALGIAMGAWGAQVPATKQHYGLDDGELAVALLAAAAGAVLCLLGAGTLVARLGARRCAIASGLSMSGVLAALLHVDAYGALLASMLLLGSAGALFDVAINAEANDLEARTRRKVMSGLHALFSLGGMAAALLCAQMHRLHWPPALQLGALAGLLAPGIAWAAAAFSRAQVAGTDAAPPHAWPHRTLLGLGIVTALCMVAEGAMYDWSALYVHESLRSDAATGALGFAAFNAAMALGRLFGDRVRERLAPPVLLRASGLFAALGMTFALVVATPGAAMAGFALVGLGLANVVPVLYAAAGQTTGVTAARGVAAVSSIGYVGFMIGPALIGAIARWQGVPTALWVVVGFALLMAAAARRVMRGSA